MGRYTANGFTVSSVRSRGVDPGPEEVAEGDVVRVNTSLVTVPVSVLDRQGRFIPDLKREDFRVFENGIEQASSLLGTRRQTLYGCTSA